MKVILPCAGFGTRCNMLPHEAKEMLQYGNEQTPLIRYALDSAEFLNAEPIVITRPDKTEFNEYLKTNEIKTLEINPKGEWMDSILASYHLWDETNILILPDTRFEPKYMTLDQIRFNLEDMNAPLVFGMHRIDDPNNWCIKDDIYMKEKPKTYIIPEPVYAFGIIGFKKSYGYNFFTDLSKKRETLIPMNSQFLKLISFQDVTRNVANLTKLKHTDSL